MKHLLPLILLLMLGACSDGGVIRINIDETAQKLTRDKVIFKSESIGNIGDMVVKGDLIVFTDNHPSSRVGFYIVNKNSGELIGTYGARGRGPNEYLNPAIIRNDNLYNNDFTLDVYDYGTNILNSLNLKDPEAVESMKEKEFRVPTSAHGINSINRLDNEILGQTIIKGEEVSWFKIANLNDGSIVTNVPFFETEAPINPDNASYIYSSHIFASPTTDKIILGMSFFDYIDVYSRKGELIKRYVFGDNPLPQLDNNGSISKYVVFTHMSYSSKKHCYYLRYGTDMNRPNYDDTGMTLIKLDWKGKLVNQYKIDDFLYAFCIDEESNKLLGVLTDRETGTVSIVSYGGL